MARLSKVRVKGFRSIRDECEISVPKDMPLVLIGENNAGKSNIVRAIDLLLGDYWPGSRDVDDHDFWGRAPEEATIEIEVYADDLYCERNGEIESLYWGCRSEAPREPSFRAFTPDREHKYVNKQLRQQCQAMMVGADRRLSYQLSYTSKRTMLSRLMHRFHECLVKDPERVARLKQEFSAIVDIFGEVEEFHAFREGLSERLGEVLDGMDYGLEIDFSAYDPSDFFHSLRVLPKEDGEARSYDEMGTGQEQVLALIFGHAYARAFYDEGVILIIEEPEAHLHPLAQQWLGRTIRAMAKDGLQVILTTHSPAFVDILGLEGIALIRKTEGATTAKQLTAHELAEVCLDHGADAERADDDTILPFYANSATPEIVAGLFARKIVLVEGPTEGMSLPIYLRRAKLDTLRHGVAIVPVLGKGNLAKWWRFFTAFEIPVYVIFDNDGEDDKKGRKRHDILTTLGVAAGDAKALLEVGDWLIHARYSIFGRNFETTLRAGFPDYEELEAEAREELGGSSKSLIAKYVADNLEMDVNSDAWKKWRELAKAIRSA
jgi:putative ATP-dependent endonuclease of the OLD family